MNPQSWVGRYKIRDVNGDGKIGAEDRTIIGNPHPDFTGGVNLSVGWKGFDLSTFLYFSVGNDLYKHYQYYTHFGALQSNFSKDRLETLGIPLQTRMVSIHYGLVHLMKVRRRLMNPILLI